MKLTDKQVDHMVSRFLGWLLPEDFHPDAGISYEPEFNKEYMAKEGKPPMRHTPYGTNLFHHGQAREMIEYMLEDMPKREHECQNPCKDYIMGGCGKCPPECHQPEWYYDKKK